MSKQHLTTYRSNGVWILEQKKRKKERKRKIYTQSKMPGKKIAITLSLVLLHHFNTIFSSPDIVKAQKETTGLSVSWCFQGLMHFLFSYIWLYSENTEAALFLSLRSLITCNTGSALAFDYTELIISLLYLNRNVIIVLLFNCYLSCEYTKLITYNTVAFNITFPKSYAVFLLRFVKGSLLNTNALN